MALIKCTHCGATGNAPDHVLGSQVRCSKCKQSFVAAAGGAAAPPLDEAFDDEPEDARVEDERDEDEEIEERPRRRTSRRDRDEENRDDDDDDRGTIRIRTPTAGGIGDVLTFRKLLGKLLVQIIFWLAIAGVLVMAFAVVLASTQGGATGVVIGLLLALVYVVLFPIFIRFYTEVAAAIFQINETLIEIRDELRRKE